MGYFNSYSYYNRNQSISYSASTFRVKDYNNDEKYDKSNSKPENFTDIINKLIYYYNRILACKSGTCKRENFDAFYTLWFSLSKNAKIEINKYFKLDFDAHLYKDRIILIKEYCENDLITKNIETKNFNTTNEANIPKDECGLYFIGQCLVNPHTEEIRYFVKVGKAINFTNRMKSYETHLPMCWHIDFLNVDEDDIFYAEKTYHRALEKISKRLEKKEWFEVSKNQYLTMCELGFNFFK